MRHPVLGEGVAPFAEVRYGLLEKLDGCSGIFLACMISVHLLCRIFFLPFFFFSFFFFFLSIFLSISISIFLSFVFSVRGVGAFSPPTPHHRSVSNCRSQFEKIARIDLNDEIFLSRESKLNEKR